MYVVAQKTVLALGFIAARQQAVIIEACASARIKSHSQKPHSFPISTDHTNTHKRIHPAALCAAEMTTPYCESKRATPALLVDCWSRRTMGAAQRHLHLNQLKILVSVFTFG